MARMQTWITRSENAVLTLHNPHSLRGPPLAKMSSRGQGCSLAPSRGRVTLLAPTHQEGKDLPSRHKRHQTGQRTVGDHMDLPLQKLLRTFQSSNLTCARSHTKNPQQTCQWNFYKHPLENNSTSSQINLKFPKLKSKKGIHCHSVSPS